MTNGCSLILEDNSGTPETGWLHAFGRKWSVWAEAGSHVEVNSAGFYSPATEFESYNWIGGIYATGGSEVIADSVRTYRNYTYNWGLQDHGDPRHGVWCLDNSKVAVKGDVAVNDAFYPSSSKGVVIGAGCQVRVGGEIKTLVSNSSKIDLFYADAYIYVNSTNGNNGTKLTPEDWTYTEGVGLARQAVFTGNGSSYVKAWFDDSLHISDYVEYENTQDPALGFKKISEAISRTNNGGTIKVVNGIGENFSSNLQVNKNMTIDLAGRWTRMDFSNNTGLIASSGAVLGIIDTGDPGDPETFGSFEIKSGGKALTASGGGKITIHPEAEIPIGGGVYDSFSVKGAVEASGAGSTIDVWSDVKTESNNVFSRTRAEREPE